MTATTSTVPPQQCAVRDEMLKCPICSSQLANPHVLRCQHTFCFRCLKGCLQKKTNDSTDVLKCPVCRKKMTLGKDGIKDIPKNLAVAGMLRLIKKASEKNSSSSQACVVGSVNRGCSSRTSGQSSSKKASSGHKKRQSLNPHAHIDKDKSRDSARSKSPSGGLEKDRHYDSLDLNKNRARKKRFTLGGTDTENAWLVPGERFSWLDYDFYPSSGDEECECEDWCESTRLEKSVEWGGGDTSKEDKIINIPHSPEMKSFSGIRLHMPIYVFGQSGNPHRGIVHVLEKVELPSRNSWRVYAGVALERENGNLVTKDLKEIKHSYLYSWLTDTKYPCAVVSIDQCCSRKKLETLLEKF